MLFPRASGILLHPTSLPNRFGIGDLGEAAYRFADFLAAADQTYWQVLPLGPTGYGDSPYQCFSAFAGNPLLVSPDRLVEQGLLAASALRHVPDFPPDTVDYGWVIPWKFSLLKESFQRFQSQARQEQRDAFYLFCQHQAAWLDDYALFMALKEAHGGAVWSSWERPLAMRQPEALAEARTRLAESCQMQQYLQWLFFVQWAALRDYAHQKHLRIIGDIPIFVAYDSADVWANPGHFFLDDDGRPTVVAGVPPDYFSPTGQLWGNPLYRWDALAATGYAWWLKRIRSVLQIVDVLRIDHFRGFAGYWEVPATETTAINGRWVPGPGADLFLAVERSLGQLPLIAEDLGVITPDVEALRDRFHFPGMKVLQFAFSSGPENVHLPHNCQQNCILYTGTHDNDTTVGWYRSRLDSDEAAYAIKYLNTDGHDIAWDLIRAAWAGVPHTAIAPLQDLLRLGTEARFNFPSRASGNWGWRFRAGALGQELQRQLAEVTCIYGRKKTA